MSAVGFLDVHPSHFQYAVASVAGFVRWYFLCCTLPVAGSNRPPGAWPGGPRPDRVDHKSCHHSDELAAKFDAKHVQHAAPVSPPLVSRSCLDGLLKGVPWSHSCNILYNPRSPAPCSPTTAILRSLTPRVPAKSAQRAIRHSTYGPSSSHVARICCSCCASYRAALT